MTSEKPATSQSSRSSRTRAVTVASIVAVGLAGLLAIGANLGILSSTDDTKVGTLAAAGDLIPTDTRVIDAQLDSQGQPLPSDATVAAGSQRFTVDAAGSVEVAVDGDAVRVQRVTPASGWTARPATDPSGAAITFTHGTRTLHFTATLAADGSIAGDVIEAVTPAPAARTHQDDDDHKADDHPSDDHKADDHGSGGTSDDHHYEGRDADD